MIRKLSIRLAIIYVFVFIAALSTIDLLLIFAYRSNQFSKTEAIYNEVAGILSSMVERNIKIAGFVNIDRDIAPESLSGRILYLDVNGKVLSDSLNEYEGRIISNNEIRATLEKGEASTGYYTINNRHMAMFTYPVFQEGEASGIILVSAYIDEVYRETSVFVSQVVLISAVVFIIVFIISMLAGERITKPVRLLTGASLDILDGKLGAHVHIKRKDEIGVLAQTFNLMSEELHKIDTGRKRFISDVSHELKTPLASMKVLVESLMDGRQDQKTCLEYLGDVNSEIDRLTALVNSLLTSARLEEIQLRLEPVSVGQETEAVIRAFTPLAQGRGILLENRCNADAWADMDREMFREVLINLVDNGIKYGREGGCLTVSTRLDNGRLELLVEDDGIGIGEKDIPNIFDSFYRVDGARARDSGGSGVGLFIVKRISELHGWNVSVQSEPGRGTRFVIILKT